MMSAARPLPIRLRDVVAGEVTKLVTSPYMLIMVMVATCANLALAVVAASGVGFYTQPDQIEPVSVSSFGMVMFAPVYAFLALPVYAAAGEYRGEQIRMTLLAVPNRRALMAGKTAGMLAVVVVATAIAVIPARLIIDIPADLGVSGALLDIARWAAVYLLMSAIAFGLAGLLRSAIATLGILIAVPVVVGTGILQWPQVLRLLPDQAALSLLGTPGYDVTALPPAVAAATLVIWAGLCLTAYALALWRRDT
ncbi:MULTISPECIES: ABC transporter [unclassified Actinomyces]|uniref:ABC transporter n=1 Tax=unclassified Actinomyces TaxID=2609248 RepID=UPI000D58F45C|nr:MULTISPECIES: ABC transporter [unclassified Actinomyces]RAX22854.1 ABC transporter [Actinomyces sp. Z3]